MKKTYRKAIQKDGHLTPKVSAAFALYGKKYPAMPTPTCFQLYQDMLDEAAEAFTPADWKEYRRVLDDALFRSDPGSALLYALVQAFSGMES